MCASVRIGMALCLLAFSASALADWKRDYARAERAFRDGNFAEAERLFRAAAAEESAPDARKRFEGVVFRDYAPQFWAGMAAWRQGSCDRALDYWQDSANNQTMLATIKDFKSQQDRGLTECRQKLAQTAPSPTPTPTPPVAVVTPAPAQPAPAHSTPAQSVPTQPAPSRPAQQTPSQSAPAPVVVRDDPASSPRPVASAVKAPAGLVAAAEAWIGGRYAAVLAVQPASLSEPKARAHVHVLRAAAHFAQSELGTTSSLAAAEEEVRAAKRALAAISPDASLFSPRFRAFFQRTR